VVGHAENLIDGEGRRQRRRKTAIMAAAGKLFNRVRGGDSDAIAAIDD
jgi:AcrR family transcriptional regulator